MSFHFLTSASRDHTLVRVLIGLEMMDGWMDGWMEREWWVDDKWVGGKW